MALCAPAYAQDAGTPAPEAEPAVEAPAPVAVPVTEDAADADAPAAEEFTTETFGDWDLRCSSDRTNCFMYQLARDEGGNPVAEITILKLPEGEAAAAGATIVTPLGTLLPAGMVVQIDSGQARKYEFSWCTRSGCFSRFGLEPDYIANMKAGSSARVRILSVTAPDRPIDLRISLSGFTAAFDGMPAQPKG